MRRSDALPYVGHAVDSALAVRKPAEMPHDAVLVGWQCGFEPMFVAVWSYFGCAICPDEAIEIACDYLDEIGWFNGPVREPDYVIQ